MKKVKQEHKQFEVEKLQIMLNAVGFNFDYQTVDLIARTLKVNKPKVTISNTVQRYRHSPIDVNGSKLIRLPLLLQTLVSGRFYSNQGLIFKQT